MELALLILVLCLLVGPVLGIAAFIQARAQNRRLDAMERRLAAALDEIARQARPAASQPEPSAPAAPAELEHPVETLAAPVTPVAALPRQSETAGGEIVPPVAETAMPAAEPPAGAAPREPPRFRPPPETLEQRLTSRWMLWLGALALALAGSFLVKYAIDEGWLGPTARVTAGFLVGCALMGCGEWLRERPVRRALAAIRPDYVPPALTAGGLSIAFSSAYAAFELYNLLSPLAAFAALGVLAVGAVLLSLLQGPLIALLGIVGGFATPLLVSSRNPSALGLFVYLLFLIAAAFGVVRYTRARWLGLLALAGAVGWPLLWFAGPWQPGDAAALGCYLLALGALALLLPAPDLPRRDPPDAARLLNPGGPEFSAALAALCVCALGFILLRMDSYGSAALTTLVLLAALSCLLAWRAPVFDLLPVLTAISTLAGMAAWHIPAMTEPASPRPVPPQMEAIPATHLPAIIPPPEPSLFLTIAALFAVLFGAAGFLALWRARRPVPWAAVSAATPVLLLAIAYWRIEAFGLDLQWCVAALLLAGLAVAAATRLEPHRRRPPFALALGCYAAAATAALGLGFAMALQLAWLTVALSLEVSALAWIARRLELQALRPIAGLLAAVVLLRLVANPDVLDYRLGPVPALNWMLYGYGIPCAAFLAAARWFRSTADDWLVTVLEAGALLFATLLLTLEIHNAIAGSLHTPRSGLLEASLQSIAWLAIALGLARGRHAARPVAIWGGRLLAAAAVCQIVVVQMLLHNPLWSNQPIGDVPVFDLLLLAYGTPALLLLAYGRVAIRHRNLAWGCFVLSLLLLLLDLSLEVRHGFQGAILSGPAVSDPEWYSYSAAWLGFAGLLLVLAIRSGSIGLRYGSLAVLLITVGKVFLSDMAALTGLYRVASFFGLGLCLIGVGYLYQRFVFPLRER